jgi:hypothetical protein
MKKVFFSVIALVAFSFAGMANEIEEKKVEVETTKNQKVEVETKQDCRLAKFQAYVDSRSEGFSHDDASGLSYSVYFLCMSLSIQ